MALHEHTRALLNAYIDRELGTARNDGMPHEWLSISGDQVIDLLWPLNAIFHPVIHQVKSVSYQPRYEADADEAIERYVFDGISWDGQEPGVWRVLLERQHQAIMVAMANELVDNPMFSMPSGLSESARTCVAMLFWLHRMKLPFPVREQGTLELPEAMPPVSLRKQ